MYNSACDRESPVENIIGLYRSIKEIITRRVEEFQKIKDAAESECLFAELVFCLFTPQSRAVSCWAAVERLMARHLLLEGAKRDIVREMAGVRFHHTKADNLILARRLFVVNGHILLKTILDSFTTPYDARDWLVANVRGMGFKEASHFLRNTGYGLDLAILDRHILRTLCGCGSIEALPVSLNRNTYLEIEHCMQGLAEEIHIPVSHLDLVLWYRQTGDIFK